MPTEPEPTPKTIVLRGNLSNRHEEARANAALSPGHIIKKNASNKVLKHATAGGGGQLWVAKERGMFGTPGGTINDAYAADDVVFYHIPQKGDVLSCRVAAAAVAIAFNDPLTSDGAGGLKKGNGTSEVTFGFAMDALDNSAGAEEAFLRVEVP
jgi:hypothetical protein